MSTCTVIAWHNASSTRSARAGPSNFEFAPPAPPPAPATPVPQTTIVGEWKFSQFNGLGDIYLTFTEDGRYRVKTAFSDETGQYVFNSNDGSLRLQNTGFFSHDTKIWHCHLSQNSLGVLEDDTGANVMYARIQ